MERKLATCAAFAALIVGLGWSGGAAVTPKNGHRSHPHPSRRFVTAGPSLHATLPERCDLRDIGYLSPVRNQSPYGTCWAFATMASLEFQLRRGEGIEADFSENNLVNRHGFAWGFDDGGNNWMATAVLLREEAPVTEVLDPYPRLGTSVRERGVRIPRKVVFISPRTTVEEGPTFEAELNRFKQAVMEYGAVSTAYYHDGEYYNADSYGYRCDDDSHQDEINHAVTLVGWDDGYPAYNFRTEPPADGAFIVRNSWGTGWGDGGYFYISYYDCTLGFDDDNCVWLNLTDGSDFGHLYQYDTFGRVNDLGDEETMTASAANVFTARDDERLAAFGVYALTDNTTYNASLVLNPVVAGETVSGTTIATAAGTIAEAGYQVIDFDTKPAVGAGTNFALVVTLTSITYTPLAVTANEPGYTTGVVARAGLSYMKGSLSGSTWQDISRDARYFCGKVYAAVKDTSKTATGEIPVSRAWLRKYAGSEVSTSGSMLANRFYGAFDALAAHVAANGLSVEASYARGLDPDAVGQTNLLATITLNADGPAVGVTPSNTNLWNYTILSSPDFQTWRTRTAGDTFFKVRVTDK